MSTVYQVILQNYTRNRQRLHDTIRALTGFNKKITDKVIDEAPSAVITSDNKQAAMNYLRELQNNGAIARVRSYQIFAKGKEQE